MLKVDGYIIRLDTAQNNLNNGITNGSGSSIHADFLVHQYSTFRDENL